MILLVYPGQVFAKSDSGNFAPPVGVDRFTKTLIEWEDIGVDHAELKNSNYNISLSRYIHTDDEEIYMPLVEIVVELDVVEAKARKTDNALREILERIGV